MATSKNQKRKKKYKGNPAKRARREFALRILPLKTLAKNLEENKDAVSRLRRDVSAAPMVKTLDSMCEQIRVQEFNVMMMTKFIAKNVDDKYELTKEEKSNAQAGEAESAGTKDAKVHESPSNDRDSGEGSSWEASDERPEEEQAS